MFGFNKKETLRKEKYKLLCGANSMAFLDKDEFGTKALLSYFELFKSGRGTIRNLCQSKSAAMDEEVHIFDYSYVVSTGKTTATFDQTVFFVNSKKLGLPEFNLKPEHLGHKIATFLGWDDIDFEQYPVFSDKYHLTGEHESFIRSTFDDEVLKFFSKTTGWTVEAANYYLIFYHQNKLVPENTLADFYRLGLGIYGLFQENET